MKLAGRKHLAQFVARHADLRSSMGAWVAEVEEAQWHTPSDVKVRYPSASFLQENRVIFNLKGNKYRLDTKISFENQAVLVVRIGTHADYSKWTF